MKVRATVVIDFELTDKEAHEKFGVYDPQSLAQSMQTEAQAELTDKFKQEHRVVHASVTVHPLYG